jgi:hypothetical protein
MALSNRDELRVQTQVGSGSGSSLLTYLPYLLAGAFFGLVAIRSEIASWYRIYEMFRFESFHMYGVIGSCLLYTSPSPRDRG